ncbi:shikimate kinase [gut metagenome]|uniref:Shikimate kinase n=1 Tax=gut metagenome TaxID=749906 RepID=J9GN01_9ZZZZ
MTDNLFEPTLQSLERTGNEQRCIILIGYMCAGKTTVGKSLAKALNRSFYDLDWYIEERFHKKVPQIFEEEGEAKFRDLERRMLHEVAEFENIVLSCGGGTPCFFDNMAYMNAVADTYYLKASPDTLCSHVAMSRGERPLLKGKSPEELREYITEQVKLRSVYYEQAQHIIDINVLDTFDKINDIVQMIIQQR